jgi:site-specific DNA recombinase
MKAAIYIRVSTPGQAINGESLDMQKERLIEYVKAHDWELYKAYEDGGFSGKDTDRPGFQSMMSDVQQSKFDILLVYKIDRLSRSILDFHTTMKILQEHNISFVSLTQQFDTSTSMGRLMLNILVDFANFEREINVDRAIDSFLNRFYKGLHSGQTPYGYIRENGNNLVIHPEQSEVVKKVFNLANQGITSRAIAKEVKLGVDRVKTILDNPVYAGYLAPRRDKHGYHGQDITKWIKGNHEAIISLDLFFSVQKKYKKGQRPTKHTAIFQKLIYCPYCKHNYSFYARKNKKIKYFYRCVPLVVGGVHCYRKIDEDFLESLLMENIGKIFDTSISEETSEIEKDIEKEIKRIDSKIEKVLDLDIETLPKDKIKKKIEQLQQEKIELLHQQKKTAQSQNVTQYFKQIEEIYPYANREERKRLWNITIQRIAIYDDFIEIFWNNGKKTRCKKGLKSNSVSKVREGGVEPPAGCPTGT